MATPVARTGSGDSPVAPANSVAEFLFSDDFGSSAITAFRINGDGSLSRVGGTPFVAGEAPRKVAALGRSLIAAGRASLVVYSVERDTGSLHPTDSVVLAPLHDFVVDASASLIYAASGGEIFAYRLAGGMLQPLPGSPYSLPDISPAEIGARDLRLMLDPSRNSLQIRFQVISPDRSLAGLIATMPRNADGSLEPAVALPGLAGDATALRSPVLDVTGRFAYLVDTSAAVVFAYRFEGGKLMPLSPAAYPTGEEPVSIAVVAP